MNKNVFLKTLQNQHIKYLIDITSMAIQVDFLKVKDKKSHSCLMPLVCFLECLLEN